MYVYCSKFRAMTLDEGARKNNKNIEFYNVVTLHVKTFIVYRRPARIIRISNEICICINIYLLSHIGRVHFIKLKK